jgi:hypothetical protein
MRLLAQSPREIGIVSLETVLQARRISDDHRRCDSRGHRHGQRAAAQGAGLDSPPAGYASTRANP